VADLRRRALIEAIATEARQTRHETFRELFDAPRAIQADDAGGAVARFVQMESEIERQGDARMVQGEHLRAWLLAAVGPLLRGVMLASDVADDELTQATVERLAMPFARELPVVWILANEYGEKHLDLIYNLKMTPTGLAYLDDVTIRVGQGETWRETWGWLSCDIEPNEMSEAIQLTARVMRCAPVLEGLMRALRSDQPGLQTVALCVLRRWLLTLKAMSWLEASVLQTWRHIRPQDLACFAFNALKPDWPRRILAVSHRSTDAKSELSTMKLWRSSRCAIDASSVPSWETNTGMVWGLFGATPAIVRVHSSGYDASIWCLREAELTQHLAERLDFVAGRLVFDVDVSNVRALDNAVALWHTGDEVPDDGLAAIVPEFPPRCEVWTPSPMPAWEVKIWRASAALRAINVWAAWNPELTNRIAQEFLRGTNDLPGPAPTNNPAGWRDYASIFQELHTLLGDEASEAALRIPSTYGTEAQEHDLDLLQRVPDLSSGTPALGDVLVALEFLRTEWPIVVQEQRTRFMAINCRGLSRETFADDERLSLHRGLLEIRVPVPVWIIQSAEEHVEQGYAAGPAHLHGARTPSVLLDVRVLRRPPRSTVPLPRRLRTRALACLAALVLGRTLTPASSVTAENSQCGRKRVSEQSPDATSSVSHAAPFLVQGLAQPPFRPRRHRAELGTRRRRAPRRLGALRRTLHPDRDRPA
jgi:hypothetical protein